MVSSVKIEGLYGAGGVVVGSIVRTAGLCEGRAVASSVMIEGRYKGVDAVGVSSVRREFGAAMDMRM